MYSHDQINRIFDLLNDRWSSLNNIQKGLLCLGFICLGFIPTGSSDLLYGRMTVHCGLMRWNQSVELNNVRLTCEKPVENRTGNYIEVRSENRRKETNVVLISPFSSEDVASTGWGVLHERRVNIEVVDVNQPRSYEIMPDFYGDSGEENTYLWGHIFHLSNSTNNHTLTIHRPLFINPIRVEVEGAIHNTKQYEAGITGGLKIQLKNRTNPNAPEKVKLYITKDN